MLRVENCDLTIIDFDLLSWQPDHALDVIFRLRVMQHDNFTPFRCSEMISQLIDDQILTVEVIGLHGRTRNDIRFENIRADGQDDDRGHYDNFEEIPEQKQARSRISQKILMWLLIFCMIHTTFLVGGAGFEPATPAM